MGTFCGLGTTLWLYVGARLYPPNIYPAPAISLQECSAGTLNKTTGLTNDSRLYFGSTGEEE